MYRYKQNLSHSKRVHNPNAAGWSVRKSSTHRVSPYNKQETSQLMKAEDPVASAAATAIMQRKDRPVSNKTKSSKMLGAVHAALVQESRNFNVQLKALEPTIKSISPRLQNRTQEIVKQNHLQFKKNRDRSTVGLVDSPLFSEEEISKLSQPAPPSLPGEKLITIGGYIVSLLQTAPAFITSTVRPRISSNKEGLELEVKILGCHPTDIKFEKRYNTLIVIGIANPNSPIKRLEQLKTAPLAYIMESRGKQKDEIKSSILGSRGHQHQGLVPTEHVDDICEIVNIFVPKNVSINQIFITKPDAKGRIFVKGP